MQVNTKTIPKIHNLSPMKVLGPTFNPIDTEQVTEPVQMDHSMQVRVSGSVPYPRGLLIESFP